MQAHSLKEVEAFIGIASCLLVNMGTLDPDWLESMKLCSKKCVELQKPWVLDPVGAGVMLSFFVLKFSVLHRAFVMLSVSRNVFWIYYTCWIRVVWSVRSVCTLSHGVWIH